MTTLAKMKAAKILLIWQAVLRPGSGKVDKRPHYANGPFRGKTDTPADRANLATYKEAEEAAAERGEGWGLGIALGQNEHGDFLQGVDLDNVKENGLTDLADSLPGYVEKSPSGRGFHAIGYGRRFETLGSNTSGIEAYASGRFFTFTGSVVRDPPVTCLADYVEEELAPRHGSKPAPAASLSTPTPITVIAPQVVAALRSALNTLRSDEYALWVRIGLALKTVGDVGRGLWLDWSATSPKFDPQDAAEKWESFDPHRTNYRVVFTEAQARGWINPASNAARLDAPAESGALPNATATTLPISATPFIAPATTAIPPRPWLFGRWLLRGTVAAVIAPGGTGKSALTAALALALASGKEFLGKAVWGGPKRVWLWNLEDDYDELTRQIAACASHHGIAEQDYRGRLFLNGPDTPLCLAAKNRAAFAVDDASAAALTRAIGESGVDAIIIDPFVSSHRADENDNMQIDAVVKQLAMIARDTGCAVVLAHHSSKRFGQAVDADASRGASALTNATRTVLGLNTMDSREAARFGISEAERRRYVRVSNEKANRAPAGQSDWFRLVSVNLGNGGPLGGDEIAVIERWTPSDPSLEAFAYRDSVRAAIQAKIAAGEWRASILAADWAGKAVADGIGADPGSGEGKAAVKTLRRRGRVLSGDRSGAAGRRDQRQLQRQGLRSACAAARGDGGAAVRATGVVRPHPRPPIWRQALRSRRSVQRLRRHAPDQPGRALRRARHPGQDLRGRRRCRRAVAHGRGRGDRAIRERLLWLHWVAARAGENKLIAVPLADLAAWLESRPDLAHLAPFATCRPALWARPRALVHVVGRALANAQLRSRQAADERTFAGERPIF